VENGKFGTLFAKARVALLDGSHQVQSAPLDGDLRWGVSVILRPDAAAAAAIERVASDAASVVGPDHWLPGAAATAHLTVRARLEPHRAVIADDDPLIARYANALSKAARRSGPMRFTLAGLTLTPVSVMACAAPSGATADKLAEDFADELAAAGLPDIGRPSDIWYVNLVYFTGPVRDAAGLIDWITARRATAITEIQVTAIQLTRWRYTGTGMAPDPILTIPVPPASRPSRCRRPAESIAQSWRSSGNECAIETAEGGVLGCGDEGYAERGGIEGGRAGAAAEGGDDRTGSDRDH
jgi:hypothetical protein